MAGRALIRFTKNSILNSNKRFAAANWCLNQTVQYASAPQKAAKGIKIGGKGQKRTFEVETDAKLLCSRLCGGNYMKEGEDPILGKDEDYPDWLWELRTEKDPIPLEELSEDDIRYWRRLKRMTFKENNKMRRLKKF